MRKPGDVGPEVRAPLGVEKFRYPFEHLSPYPYDDASKVLLLSSAERLEVLEYAPSQDFPNAV